MSLKSPLLLDLLPWRDRDGKDEHDGETWFRWRQRSLSCTWIPVDFVDLIPILHRINNGCESQSSFDEWKMRRSDFDGGNRTAYTSSRPIKCELQSASEAWDEEGGVGAQVCKTHRHERSVAYSGSMQRVWDTAGIKRAGSGQAKAL